MESHEKLLRRKSRQTPDELDVHGMRVEDMLVRVEKYMDDALLGGLHRVRIVHGFGSGKLQRAVWRYLKTHPEVESFDFAPPREGGGGATVVRLRTF